MLRTMKIKSILGALTVALTLANCSPKESTRLRSYADGDYQAPKQQEVAQKNAEQVKLEALLAEVEPLVVGQLQQEEGLVEAEMLMQKVIIPLRQYLLDVDYLLVGERRYFKSESGQFIVARLITLFNEAILLVNKVNPQIINGTDLLTTYKATILWDCSEGFEKLGGSCEMVKYFKSTDSVNISQIVKLIKDQEPSRSEQLRLVRAAMDMKNRRIDNALRFMLIELVSETLAAIESEDAEPIKLRQLVQRDASLFANIIGSTDLGSGNLKQNYDQLIQSLEPWKLSRNVDSSKNPAMTDIIKKASSSLLYDKDGRVSQDLASAAKGMLFAIGKDYEQGICFQRNNIKGEWIPRYDRYKAAVASDNKDEINSFSEQELDVLKVIDKSLDIDLFNNLSQKILANFVPDVKLNCDLKSQVGSAKNSVGKSEEAVLDEYFYLVNQAFYGHFNLEDSVAFWTYSKKNTRRLMEETETIIKSQIVNNIVLTNNRMYQFYDRNENTKLVELLLESDKEASKIRKAWSKTLVRAGLIKNFVNRVVNVNALSKEDKKLYDRINSSVDVLTKNIKYLVTYPNMFPLLHVMASLEMKETLQGWFGKFTIDSKTIIKFFFDGNFPPWFNFGNDDKSLDKIEIIYSYYYALLSQIFEIYSDESSNVVKFDHKDFFKVVVKKLVLENEISLDESRRALSQKFEQFKNNAKALNTMCKEEVLLHKLEKNDVENRVAELDQEVDAKFDALVAAKEMTSFEASRAKKAAKKYHWYLAMKEQMKPRRSIVNQVDFTALSTGLYDGTSNHADKLGHYIGQVYSSKVKSVFNEMRTDNAKTNLMVNSIVDVYKLSGAGDSTDIDDVVAEQFQDYNRIAAEYISLYFDAQSKTTVSSFNEEGVETVDGCEWAFAHRDRDIRHMMLFREIEYLEAYFEKVWNVYSPLSDDEKLALDAKVESVKDLEDDDLEDFLESNPLVEKVLNIREELGYYTQNSAFPKEYRDRFGYSKLTSSRLAQFKMDVSARVFSYLRELFPRQYAVTMPPDFKTVDVYRETSPELVYFNWDETDKDRAKEAFVQSGIKAFGEVMNWSKNSPSIDNMATKGSILVNLFKLGAVSKSMDIDCSDTELEPQVKQEFCIKITAADVIDHYKKIINFMNIDERDNIVLGYLGKESKYSESVYESYIKKEDEHLLYSYYDLIFRRIYSDSKVSESEKSWFRNELVKFVESMQKIEGSTFIFPNDPRIYDVFADQYKQWVNTYYEINAEFLEEVKKQQKEFLEKNQGKDESEYVIPYRYRTDRYRRLLMEKNEDSSNEDVNLEPYISDLVYGKFQGLTQQLDNDTSRVFQELLEGHSDRILETVKGE